MTYLIKKKKIFNSNYRQVLRRLTMNQSPGGTPKSTSALVEERDDLTPMLTRALLKRFDALNLSPEDSKENDAQFV